MKFRCQKINSNITNKKLGIINMYLVNDKGIANPETEFAKSSINSCKR